MLLSPGWDAFWTILTALVAGVNFVLILLCYRFVLEKRRKEKNGEKED